MSLSTNPMLNCVWLISEHFSSEPPLFLTKRFQILSDALSAFGSLFCTKFMLRVCISCNEECRSVRRDANDSFLRCFSFSFFL